jgi:Lrp/AsnC family leucine-responsive transcriptional regulator
MDRKILALLQQDGRRPLADIGRAVGLSTPAVKRRVDRLEANGVIRGYAAVVDSSKLGTGFEAIAEIYCADRTAPRDVLASVEGIPEVVSAVTVSGEPDAVLRVRVGDIRHLEHVIEMLRRQPNIVRTRTMIVLSVLVDRP